MLLYTVQTSLTSLWHFWSGIFEPIPYGDPYLAIISIFVILAVSAKLIFGRETS